MVLALGYTLLRPPLSLFRPPSPLPSLNPSTMLLPSDFVPGLSLAPCRTLVAVWFLVFPLSGVDRALNGLNPLLLSRSTGDFPQRSSGSSDKRHCPFLLHFGLFFLEPFEASAPLRRLFNCVIFWFSSPWQLYYGICLLPHEHGFLSDPVLWKRFYSYSSGLV